PIQFSGAASRKSKPAVAARSSGSNPRRRPRPTAWGARAWGASAVGAVIAAKVRPRRLDRAAFALAALAFHVGLGGGFVGPGGCLGGVAGLHLVGVDEAVAVAVVRGEPAAVAVVGGGEFGRGQRAVLIGVHLR